MSKTCSGCGTWLNDDAKFCTYCGTPCQPIAQEPIQPQTAPEAIQEPVQQPVQEPVQQPEPLVQQTEQPVQQYAQQYAQQTEQPVQQYAQQYAQQIEQPVQQPVQQYAQQPVQSDYAGDQSYGYTSYGDSQAAGGYGTSTVTMPKLDKRKKLIIILSAAGVLVIGGVILLIVLLTGGGGKGASSPEDVIEKFESFINASDMDLDSVRDISLEYTFAKGEYADQLKSQSDSNAKQMREHVRSYNVTVKMTVTNKSPRGDLSSIKSKSSDYLNNMDDLTEVVTVTVKETFYQNGSEVDSATETFVCFKIDGKWYMSFTPNG